MATFSCPGEGSKHESGASVFGAMFHVGPALKEELDDLDVAEGARPGECTIIGGLGRGIDVGIAIKKQLGDAHVTLATGLEERARGVAGFVAMVDVGAAFKEKLDYVLLSLTTGETQHFVQANFGLGDRAKDALRSIGTARVGGFLHSISPLF